MKRRVTTVVAVMALALALSAGAALAATIICTGGPCNGTPDDDQITGSNVRDVIFAGGGGDNGDAMAGPDDVYLQGGFDGRGGRDTILLLTIQGFNGGAGDDIVRGQAGGDTLRDDGTLDDDVLKGGGADDNLYTNDGDNDDVANGGKGFDVCTIDPGDTVVSCEFVQ